MTDDLHDQLDRLEEGLLQQLRELQRRYEREAAPILAELVKLRNARPMPLLMADPEALKNLANHIRVTAKNTSQR